MTAALQALQDQYDFLTANLPKLLEACNGDAGKENQINAQYAACEANYTSCINNIFNDDDPNVQTLVAQMKIQQAALAQAVQHLNNTAGAITAITTAVQTGASLAAKV